MKNNYISNNEEWMLDWDYENNSKLPSEVTIGSRQRSTGCQVQIDFSGSTGNGMLK